MDPLEVDCRGEEEEEDMVEEVGGRGRGLAFATGRVG